MNFSKLMYARSLVKEVYKIEEVMRDEYAKQRKNQYKIELLAQTKAEVLAERERISTEVKEWIKETPTSPTFQNEMYEFFIKGQNILRTNFHREVEYLFGENKYYKAKYREKK